MHALVIFLWALLFSQTAPVKEISTEHFRIRYDKEIDTTVLRKTKAMLEEEYEQCKKELALSVPRKIAVRLVTSRARYKVEVENAMFEGGEFQSDKIILHTGLLEQDEKKYRNTIMYCVVTGITAQYTLIPRWFGTAYALYTGNQIQRFEQYTPAQMFTFADIDEEFDRASNERELKSVYCALGRTINYFISKYGERNVRSVFAELKRGKSINTAFSSAFGEDIESLHREWQRVLGQRPK